MNRILSTIIFDYGGVICTQRRSSQFSRWLEEEYEIDHAHTESIIRTSAIWDRYVVGQATSDEAYAPLIELGAPSDVAMLKKKYASFGIPDPEMQTLIFQLRSLSIDLVIVSDSIPELTEVIRHHFQNVFRVEIFSEEVGVRKPNPSIYNLMLHKIGKPSQECLFVDDLEINLEYPRVLGMKTYLFDSLERFRYTLEKTYNILLYPSLS